MEATTLDFIDFGTLAVSAILVLAPVTIRTMGLWSWTAWLPPRLRAMEDRRALALVRKLVVEINQERHSSDRAPSSPPGRYFPIEEFIEAADGVARILPTAAGGELPSEERPVSERLRALASEALERALDPASEPREPAHRRRLAQRCIDILRKLPSSANARALRTALDSSDPEIARHAAAAIALAPHVLRDAVTPPAPHERPDEGFKVYRAQNR